MPKDNGFDAYIERENYGGCCYCDGFGAVYEPVPGHTHLERQVPCAHCQDAEIVSLHTLEPRAVA